MPQTQNRLYETVQKHEDDLLKDWLSLLEKAGGRRPGTADDKQLSTHTRDFLSALLKALKSGNSGDLSGPEWNQVRELLGRVTASRARAGSTPAQTAAFVFSLKEPLFRVLRHNIADARELADEIWNTTIILDRLAVFTTEEFQRTREEVISRQQQEMLELSTPVVRLWDNVLALPLIGTLDSARSQVVMQNLLEAIVATRSDIAILDITGVPMVDTLVAQHLLKTVAAARLMGADCIISGIRPQIAQTIIHLGVNLEDVTTKATLADAFALALERTGFAISRAKTAVSNENRNTR